MLAARLTSGSAMPPQPLSPRKVDLAEAFARFHDHWSPKIAGELNDFQVKLVKLRGEFVWHRHEHEDELFQVVKGRLTMRLRSGELVLDPGQFVIVPHGLEHCPAAEEECWVLLLEPATTLNTGDVENERTVRVLGRLDGA
jgi:mannose-6-phosphate isomerase-like protein (cupin superfamily)